jgi:hypothetical protein
VAIQEGFRIQDILNLFELPDVDLLGEMHQISGSNAGSEGDEDALARSGEPTEMQRDRIGQGFVNG